MQIQELDFDFPEHLIATERAPVSRVMLVRADDSEPEELADKSALVGLFEAGDVLVINDTRVLSRRVFSESGLEILFLKSAEDRTEWDVLCPSSRWKEGTRQSLPDGVTLELVSRGRPQKVRASRPLTESFFEQHGELPLPPYIQKARGERHNRQGEKAAYQTAWAEKDGSLAAPTASLHFDDDDLLKLETKGVRVVRLTLHVGLGTFLPVTVDDLNDHVMHGELAEISGATWAAVTMARAKQHHVWALGTTVTRTLESAALGRLTKTADGGFIGETDLFIRPGYEYQVVDRLLTNFHQPRSTLIALVAAFAGLERVKRAYAWAIARDFRLFSYGDLSVWIN